MGPRVLEGDEDLRDVRVAKEGTFPSAATKRHRLAEEEDPSAPSRWAVGTTPCLRGGTPIGGRLPRTGTRELGPTIPRSEGPRKGGPPYGSVRVPLKTNV